MSKIRITKHFEFEMAHSLLNYVLQNPNTDIDILNPVNDAVDPILYFYDMVGSEYITFDGATYGVPYDTSYGNTFSTS